MPVLARRGDTMLCPGCAYRKPEVFMYGTPDVLPMPKL